MKLLMALIIAFTAGAGVFASEPEDCDPRLAETGQERLQLRVKQHMRQAWERAKFSKRLSQTQLAGALEMSQGNVSKLLNDDSGHPWSALLIERAASLFGQQMAEIFPAQLLEQLPVTDRILRDPKAEMLAACESAVLQFLQERGRTVTAAQVHPIAEKLFASLKNSRTPITQIRIERAILEQAFQNLE